MWWPECDLLNSTDPTPNQAILLNSKQQLKNLTRSIFQNWNARTIETLPIFMETVYFKTLIATCITVYSWNTTLFFFLAIMAHYYGPDSPYYIPAYNHNCYLPPDYIHPDSAAGQLGLTPIEMAPILQGQQELMRDELTQPPTWPNIYHNHTTTTAIQPCTLCAPTIDSYPTQTHPNRTRCTWGRVHPQANRMAHDQGGQLENSQG